MTIVQPWLMPILTAIIHSMTLSRARKLLGKMSKRYSDEQLSALVSVVKSFADVCINKIDNKINSEGSEFLSAGKMQ